MEYNGIQGKIKKIFEKATLLDVKIIHKIQYFCLVISFIAWRIKIFQFYILTVKHSITIVVDPLP